MYSTSREAAVLFSLNLRIGCLGCQEYPTGGPEVTCDPNMFRDSPRAKISECQLMIFNPINFRSVSISIKFGVGMKCQILEGVLEPPRVNSLLEL